MRRPWWRSRRLATLLGLLALAGALWLARGYAMSWSPDRAVYPVQGVLLSAADGPVDFAGVAASGADFVYLVASEGSGRADAAFDRHLAAAGVAGLRVGAVHLYDACAPAEGQAARFVTQVPRDAALLPPALRLTLAAGCKTPPPRARVLSELALLLMQIEAHAGKPAVLLLDAGFERSYRVSDRIARALWLERDFLEPGYGVRPWQMWSANRMARVSGVAGPVAWVVARP